MSLQATHGVYRSKVRRYMQHFTTYTVYLFFFLFLFPPILCRYKQNMEFIVTKAGRYNILRLKEP